MKATFLNFYLHKYCCYIVIHVYVFTVSLTLLTGFKWCKMFLITIQRKSRCYIFHSCRIGGADNAFFYVLEYVEYKKKHCPHLQFDHFGEYNTSLSFGKWIFSGSPSNKNHSLTLRNCQYQLCRCFRIKIVHRLGFFLWFL